MNRVAFVNIVPQYTLRSVVDETFRFPCKGEREVQDSRSAEHPYSTVIFYPS